MMALKKEKTPLVAVFQQSVKNIIITYIGFLVGAVNTLLLYTHFLSKQEYGLVSYVTATATILSPLMSFGVQQTLIRFSSFYENSAEKAKFNAFIFLLPIIFILPFFGVGVFFFEELKNWLSAENQEVSHYVGIMFFTSVAMAYFEVFYAWARVRLKTVYGNFLKEVFHRVLTSFLLLLVFRNCLTFNELMYALLGVYSLRAILMAVSAFWIEKPSFSLGIPSNKKELLWYSFFIVISGSVASVLIDIDKFMINQYLPLGQIAIYNVAVFVATVVVIPYRAGFQIVSPLVAKLMHHENWAELSNLYKKTTIGTYVLSVFIFVLILINASDFYALLPDSEYVTGFFALVLLALIKLFDALLGINNAILFNSKYYKTLVYFALFLVVITIVLNIFLIPTFGISGAAMASFLAFFSYNSLKLYFVKKKYHFSPFYKEILSVSLLAVFNILFFVFIDFPFSSISNILLKSVITLVIFIIFCFKTKSIRNFFKN